jgi:uncharacterized membrane protein
VDGLPISYRRGMTYHVVLYVHLFSLLIAVAASGVMHVSDFELRRASSLAEAGRIVRRMKATGPAFAPAVVGLLGSGIYLTHDAGWGFSSSWVVTGFVGLFLIVAVGDALNARNGKRLGTAIGAALGRSGDGPLTDEVRRLLDDPIAKIGGLFPTAVALGVVYAMSVKPAPLGCALALAIPIALAIVIAPRLLAMPAERVEAAPAADTV